MLDLIIKQRPDLGRKTIEAFFRIGGANFPEKNWIDHKSIIESWRSELDADGSEIILRFMDGPFSFSVVRITQDMLQFRFFEECAENARALIHQYEATNAEYINVIRNLDKFLQSIN